MTEAFEDDHAGLCQSTAATISGLQQRSAELEFQLLALADQRAADGAAAAAGLVKAEGRLRREVEGVAGRVGGLQGRVEELEGEVAQQAAKVYRELDSLQTTTQGELRLR
jgi:hypothetical protein